MWYSWPWPPYIFHPSVPEYYIFLVDLIMFLVVLTLTNDPNPSPFCLTLVPFCMYLVIFLPPHLMSCLAQNYKVPVSCNYSAVYISKSSGSTSTQLRHVLTLTLAPCYILNSCSIVSPWISASLPDPEPTSEIPRQQQKVGTVHEQRPMSRSLHLASLWWSFHTNPKLWIPNSKLTGSCTSAS